MVRVREVTDARITDLDADENVETYDEDDIAEPETFSERLAAFGDHVLPYDTRRQLWRVAEATGSLIQNTASWASTITWHALAFYSLGFIPIAMVSSYHTELVMQFKEEQRRQQESGGNAPDGFAKAR